MKRRLTFIITLLTCAIFATAMPSDTIVSIVTVHPGSEIYELEGHTILRIKTPDSDRGVSYGTFDFEAPNFVYRFVKGETDYYVSEAPFPFVLQYYMLQGRRVVEQQVAMSPSEKKKLIELVNNNLKPENATYRYNYVYDNCATRPFSMLNAALTPNDSITLSTPQQPAASLKTFRELMRYYHENYPWYQLGIDLALGSGIDKEVKNSHKSFAPVVLEQQLINARRVAKNTPAIEQTIVLNDVPSQNAVLAPTAWYETPLAIFSLIFITALLITLRDLRRKKVTRWFDAVFYFALFILSLTLTFLIFISVHEATSPNYLYIFFNPLCILPTALIYITSCRRILVAYQAINATVIALGAIVWPLLPQTINLALLPIIATDMMRALSYVYITISNNRIPKK